MRLKHIKLVGFKSFVDATKVPFPHQMTCVVGPNGCGKSNVIDAVRWVLGESSAKNLRGDAMTDVIFNGSNARKPVSQASVELVFDNSSGRIQGEYANYAEISVKRLVTREARSDYFLNGSKCRRRDITDLFLGTGLGPRSYAIIEQGMISRLIESKPQELRVFIEEAAGISKYKERRRDTENRMQHTRDNLDRLTDVRDELGTQLDKLQRQASAAKRYKDLKQKERQYKAELQALRWLSHEQGAEQLRQQQREHEAELDKWIAEQRGSERGSDDLREQLAEAKAGADKIQQHYYELGNTITRCESEVQSIRSQQQQRLQRISELTAEIEHQQQTYQHDIEQEIELKLQYEEVQPRAEELEHELIAAQQHYDSHEQQWQQLQEAYQQHLLAQQQQREREQQWHFQKERQTSELERTQDDLRQLKLQRDQLQAEYDALACAEAEAQADQSQALMTEAEQQLQAVLTQKQQVTEQVKQASQQLLQLNHHLNQQSGRQSSLQTLLAAAQHNDWPEQVGRWLQDQQIQTLGQVRELLTVDPNWQLAVEECVGDWLDAWVLEQKPEQWPEQLGAQVVVLESAATAVPAASIAAQVSGPLQRWKWLQQIETATSLTQVNNWRAGQFTALVMPSGQCWSTAGYAAHQLKSEQSQLLQQQQLTELEADIATTETERDRLQQQLDEREQQLHQIEQLRDQQQEVVSQTRSDYQSAQDKLSWMVQGREQLQQKLTQFELRQTQLQEAEQELLMLLEETEQQRLVWEETDSLTGVDTDFEQQREQLQQQREHSKEQLQQSQQAYQQAHIQQQQLAHQIEQIGILLSRSKQQSEQAKQQLNTLQQPADEEQEQLEILALQLEEHLTAREQVDQERRMAANMVAELEQKLRELNAGSQGVETQIEQARQRLQSTQLELAAVQERTRNILAVLAEMNQPLKPLLEQLPEAAEEKKWQAELERIQQAVQRLGAINLAAIDEAETLAERKNYLDEQHQDLVASLDILENAIKKIDRETRQRFRATFDEVNTGLQELFPKVFGGGSAYLDLTDDNLLETGVTIMARPPGKKNSTIHLLSGGEKALTALSLVFAIFRLNPAPFCLLDEVDAPLDDANVGRFCRLVSEMSETVQFIYISHNKIAMEMASHLAGVTMQEPGVSRLVAVDIDEAIAMTEL